MPWPTAAAKQKARTRVKKKDKSNGSYRGDHVFLFKSSLQPVGTIYFGSTPMVLPPPIVKLFSREARKIFFEPYFFVKRHAKKITTPASKCCVTFDQTGVRQQTGHQIEAHEVVYPMGCPVELSTWNTVAKRRNQDRKK